MSSYTGCCGGYVPMSPGWYWAPYPAYYPNCAPLVAKEISASQATPGAQAMIGGAGYVYLSLEYVHDAGAESPSVKVTITETTGTGIWEIATIPDGDQVKLDFASAAPGAVVKLDVSGCTAHLKWFERAY